MTYQEELEDFKTTLIHQDFKTVTSFIPSKQYRDSSILYTRITNGTFIKGSVLRIISAHNTPVPKCIDQNGHESHSNYSKMIPFMKSK